MRASLLISRSIRAARCITAILFTFAYQLYGGGIRGTIKGDDGIPLGYATIFVKQMGTGAASDLQGKYEINLSPGTYDVTYQYLGFESQLRKLEIGSDFITADVILKTQIFLLQNVVIKAGKEDPAYTIMRKAIAKAKYHVQQVDEYTAKVYVKGKGKLIDYPWLAKKSLEKEGITKDRLFISESVSEIRYTRPNKFEEIVIAVYSNGKDNNTSPNAYVFGSLYQPEIAETISPLSPKSFSYYRFEYLGSFKDSNYEVSKIKVTPRSKGDNVFDGIIYIVEDWWSIHSLDFNVTKLGVDLNMKQIYNPIEDKAWLPVSQQFQIEGKVFGFEFEYNYLATVKDYKIKLNKDLIVDEIKIVDEKLEKEQAKEVKNKFSKKGKQLQERLAEGKEVTSKELRQLVKEYEKQEMKEQKEPNVLSDTKFSVDSMAYKKDSTFWADIRPAPLSKEETRGYKVNDSISEIERKKQEGDTLRGNKKKNKKGFQVGDILLGDTYKIGKTADFRIHTPYGGFNTVEGFNLIYRTSFYKRWVNRDTVDASKTRTQRLEISPIARYAFERERLTGMLRVDYRSQNTRLTLEAGRYIQQYNSDDPIHSFVNTFTTLLIGDNLMKIYERDFVDLNYRQRLNDKFLIKSNWSWTHRKELFNNTNYSLFKKNKEDYTPNAPVNEELANTSFANHKAFIGSIGIEARPWQKYRIRNGRKYRVENSSPLFTLEYRKGFDEGLNSQVNFDQLEIGLRQRVKVGIRGTLDIAMQAGKFFNAGSMYFMDYNHFLGNRTPIITSDPVGSFRLLDYYRYSTKDEYFTGNVHYHFRKFLFTRIPKVRLVGVTENVFVNYLATPTSGNYTELGYGLDGILRIFRLEGAVSFTKGDLSNFNYGFRIGITTSATLNFND
jgi:Family of unknown function (DUF5686)/CarboxypepD_reg-like domain